MQHLCEVSKNPDYQTPCRAFPLSTHTKRCFIRSVMPLQPAVRADTGRYYSVWGPYHPSDVLYDQPRLVIFSRQKTQFQRKPEDYSRGDSRTLLCWQGKGANAQKCLFFFLVSFIHSAGTILFALGRDASLFFFFFLIKTCFRQPLSFFLSPQRHVVKLCMMDCLVHLHNFLLLEGMK